MSETVAAHMLTRLNEWGVKKIYGYPGDGINGILGAFHEVGDKVEFVQCRHEEIAAFAACGHAKLTGDVGVCLATSGPGAIHLLNGLYDAKLDHQPVVAVVGQQSTMALGGNFQQEVDLTSLFKDVASEYVQVCMTPEQIEHLIDRAIRIAKATRSPTCVIIPNDIQESEYSPPPRTHGAIYSSTDYRTPRVIPRAEDVQAAAEVLNAGERVAILVGQGARNAEAELEEVANLLGAGVAKALNGRFVMPDELPYVTGSIGLLGTKPSYEMMENCDTLLMIGSSFPYTEFLPKVGQARGVQIDIDGRMLGIRYPMEVALEGDAKETLKELLPLLERKQERSWRQEIEANVERWWKILDEQAHIEADPVNPQLVFHELSARLPDKAILLADSGSATDWWARHLKMRKGMLSALSGTLATMRPAAPYALAAKFGRPGGPVIACMGDGAFQILGMNTLIDFAKYYERWSDPRRVLLVLHNDDLNQVTWEQRVMSGDPKLDVSQVLPDFPYAQYAELVGLIGIKVDEPNAIGPAWDRALQADRPVLIEAITDPEVPPLPPHIKFEEAKKMMKALPGDPARGEIMKQAIKGKVEEFITR